MQAPNKTQTVFVEGTNGMAEFCADSSKKIEYLAEVQSGKYMIQWKYVNDEDADQGNRCVALAAHVTAYGRIELYRAIDSLESVRPHRVLYFDTDSIIFTELPSDNDSLPMGDLLGNLTDEIDSSLRIVKFYSHGPKSYGLYLESIENSSEFVKPILKNKGIQLTYETADVLTYDWFQKAAEDYYHGRLTSIKVPQFNISADRHHNVSSSHFYKLIQPTSDKRRILTSGFTYPYGY